MPNNRAQRVLPSPILVTGASGYIASWIVRQLLEAGATVHGTVRSLGDREKTEHLDRIGQAYQGRLKLFPANLTIPGSFAEAMNGCSAVVHSASPFKTRGVRDAKRELITPALEGTRNVLQSVALTPSVTRVVLTSSLAAVYGDAADHAHEGGAFNERQWNQTSSDHHQPYAYSKTISEREAWAIAEAKGNFRLVAILPGFVLGPALSARTDATSTDTVLQMLDGRMRSGVPDLRFSMVDVRDVARAHVLALSEPTAQGRYIVAAESHSLPDLAAMLRERYGASYPIPKGSPPRLVLYLMGPMLGLSWKLLRRNLGLDVRVDNERSRRELGVTYGSVREALLEQATQLEAKMREKTT